VEIPPGSAVGPLSIRLHDIAAATASLKVFRIQPVATLGETNDVVNLIGRRHPPCT